MMKKLLIVLMCLPLLGLAQGIKFEEGLTWEQVKAKAKAENKFIFVDCYATWCLPCKKMDKEVFTVDSVGLYVNEKYISLKLQLDTTKYDDNYVKKRYSIAHQMTQQYNITTLPSYLFFDANGEILHKDVGAKESKEFMDLMIKALKPEYQYFTLLKKFDIKDIEFQKLPYLAKTARELGDKDNAMIIGGKYIRDYLQLLPDSLFFTPSNINFFGPYLKSITSADKTFQLFYHNTEKIDSIVGMPGYTRSIITSIIYREEVGFLPDSPSAKTVPKWKRIKKTISEKYNPSYGDEIVLSAKVKWYKGTKQWTLYTKYLVEKVKKAGYTNVPNNVNGLLYYNNNAWAVFQYSNNKVELNEAIKWTDLALGIDSSFQIMDTKANLLYKSGKKEQAIALEEEVLRIIIETKMVERYKQECLQTIEKMRQGIATWLR